MESRLQVGSLMEAQREIRGSVSKRLGKQLSERGTGNKDCLMKRGILRGSFARGEGGGAEEEKKG